ncbi:MAG: transposase [Leptolyngbyaceae cyanobacterium]
MLTLSRLIDDNKCYETVRQLRWPGGVCCVECGSGSVTKRGKHESHPARQRYVCGDCGRQFDDLNRQPLCGSPSALANLGCLSVSDGPQSLESTDCSRAELAQR